MTFFDQMRETKNKADNVSITENGAVGYKSTGKALLDINFAVSSMRHMEEEEITELFERTFDEDPELALRWLFFLRDVRRGLGERRSFRIIFKWLIQNHREIAEPLLSGWINADSLIPFYGRWDDLLTFYDDCPDIVLEVIKTQLTVDLWRMEQGKSSSLMAKWLPSVNTSSPKTVKFAKRLAHDLKMTPREYRKTLSSLRKHIDVVERKMSANEWDQIDYQTVPSKANLNYRDAFLKHDEARRIEFLKQVFNGEVKMNTSALYPYEIYHRMWDRPVKSGEEVTALEAMWNSLVGEAKIDKNAIVVADGSGSMCIRLARSSVCALDVAYSLALYFAELMSGEFHGKFITFSAHPQLIDVSHCESLADKIRETMKYDEVANTNIEAVFDLILQTALDHGTASDDLPETILIISDMEFDSCVVSNSGCYIPESLFDEISRRYKEHGYTLPRLVFWNVCSRTGTIPVVQNDDGVALVSGFSVNNVDMVMSGEIDPYKCLTKTLNNKRYDPVVEVLYQE